MKSSTLLRLVAVVALASFCVDSTWADSTNVLFIFTDDQSPGSLGALGHPDVKTPNIDQLYGEGFHFNQAYCMGSMIPPVCLPSRAMLMSGKSLFRAPRQLDRGALLPEVFRNAGYTTFATGKWHNGRDSWLRGFEEGEAVFFGGAARDHHDVRIERVENGQLVPDDARGKHATELFADATIAFLKRQQVAKKPFFCYVPFTAPHTPHVSPQRFQDMYDADKLQLPKNFRVAADTDRSGARARGGRRGQSGRGDGRRGRGGRRGGGRGRLGTEADARQSYVQYYAMITHLDHHIGRIVQTLKDTGQYGKTLILFASDHGYSMGNHGQRGKTSLYEHSTRAMINFSGPGIPAKGSSEALVYLYDLFPTLCDLTGLTVPEDVEGKSLAGIVRGQRQQVRDQVLTAFSDSLRALRRQDWKVYKRLREDRVELFNLGADPLELNDLSQKTEHREKLISMLAALEEAREGFGETPAVVAGFMRGGRGGFGGRGNFGGRGPGGRGNPGGRGDLADGGNPGGPGSPGGRENLRGQGAPGRRGAPGGGGGPPGGFGQQREVVAEFDKDGDKRLNVEERAAAREFLKKESAGRRRGGRFGRRGGGDTETPKPGRKLTPADVASFPDAGLYDPKVLRTFFLEFENEDWEKELADFNNTDVEVPAKLQVDGRTYENVGVHFRGMTSYMTVGEGRKRSLNLAFHFANKEQRLHGYRTINLLNSHTDPTFLRITLFSRIAREYIPTPKANYARVVINGECWGIYVNAQQFNKDFTRDWFHTSKGARWKTPGSPRGRAGLAYLGDDPDEYRSIYQIRSKDKPERWNDLIKLCRILNETPPEKLEKALEPILDLDGVLKFLAIDNALINNDGFWTRSSDYNLLQDREGRFHFVPHDMNETFLAPGGRGGPGRRGGGFGGGGMGRGQTARAIMAQADKGGDAKLDRDEFAALATLWFEKIDSEKAGKLTKEQFTSGLGAALLAPREGGEGNGRAPRPGDGPSGFIREGLFLSADLDQDGSLTQDELEKRLQRWFGEWDEEKTGSIDEDTLADGLRAAFPQPGFGGFPGGPPGGRRGGGPTTRPKVDLDPLIGLNDAGKPLLSKLLAVPALRDRYLGYVRDIAETWLDWETLGPIAREYQALIADDVEADTRKLDSTEAFHQGLEENVEASGVFGRGVKIGIKSFADQRRAYLLEKTKGYTRTPEPR